MRPHQKWLTSAHEGLGYVLRDGAIVLGGTIPFIHRGDLKNRVCDMADAAGTPSPVMHTTISLPKLLHASRKVWLSIAAASLRALGIDPDTVPWFAARHEDSACDHIHILAVCQTFTGRHIVVTGSSAKSEAAHRQLCHLTGLPQPEYFDTAAGPRLVPVTPKRRLNSDSRMQLHADLQHVFLHHQPESLEALNRHLAKRPGGFQGKVSDTGHGTTSILWQNQFSKFFSGELGDAWAPRFLKARLRFGKVLRNLRRDLDLGHLATIFNTPTMEKTLAETIRVIRACRSPQRSENHPEPAFADGSKRHDLTPAAGPVVPPRGPEGNPWGTARGTAERPDPDAEQFSDGASEHERHAVAPDAGDRNIGETVQRAADPDGDKADRNDRLGIQADRITSGTDGEEDRPDADNVEFAPRLTFASIMARVCTAAEKCAAGWRVKALHDSRGVAIIFADQSAAKVGAAIVNIVVDGAEVRRFEAAYQPNELAPRPADPDTELEIEPDEDETPGF